MKFVNAEIKRQNCIPAHLQQMFMVTIHYVIVVLIAKLIVAMIFKESMMNQKEQVLAHLKKKKTITSWEAIQKYGITRLADTIFQLKSSHDIITIIEHGDGKRWARYVYMGVNK